MKNIGLSISSLTNLSEFLDQASTLIQKELLNQIPDQEPRKFLYDLMRDYPSRGGKKFRSALVLMSTALFGGSIPEALPTAVAFELFQNFALIHDDIEDDSLMRRGKSTLHRLHGIPLALNAGDTMLGIVHETLLGNKNILDTELTFRLLEHFNKVARHTFEGQAIDIGWVHDDVFPNRSEYQEMITRKTGWYSGKGPCQCGAMIGKAGSFELECIGRFGEAIGIGFQARDDLLNLITTSESLAPEANSGGYGKERGGDIAEGKRTLITIELFDRLPANEKKRFHHILLKPREENTEEEIEWAIAQAKTTGALDAIIKYCKEYAKIAEEALNSLPSHPIREIMAELISYLAIDRNY